MMVATLTKITVDKMIVFPPDFIALRKYPGYFWSRDKQALYSLKVDGVLKKMKEQKVTRYQSRFVFEGAKIGESYFTISFNGKKKYVFVNTISRHLVKESVYNMPMQLELDLK